MKPDTNPKGFGGMSRAAKKRAKKNKKKNDNNKRPPESTKDIADFGAIHRKKIKVEDNNGKDCGERNEQKQNGLQNDDTIGIDESVNSQSETVASPPPESTHYTDIPSFSNMTLTEILLLKPTNDEEKKSALQSLTSEERAACLLQTIIDPVPLKDFYKEFWEKKPLLVRAKNKKRYDGLLSLDGIKEMSKKRKLYYARDLNVTRYKKNSDGIKRRITLDKLPSNDKEKNAGVLVDSAELWSNYEKGCTIRLLCPHKHEDNIHSLLSTLELELQCMVGANAYLTPPKSSQGFAPHYDDIEAFCLQLQGSKRWKVYEPTLKLPRESSEDFTAEDLDGMKPVMDIILEQGDLLYMPRGWVHQACTLKDNNEHSLHLTVSAMQQWAWADLLDVIMPEALEAAATSESSTSLRQGLPRGFLDYMGVMFEQVNDEKLPESLKKVTEEETLENFQIQQRKVLQEKFRAEAKKRIMKVAKTVRCS